MADKYLNLSGLQYLWNKIVSELSSTDKVDIYTFNTTTYSDVSNTISNGKLKCIAISDKVYPVIRFQIGTNRIDMYVIQYSNDYQIAGIRINSSDTWSYISVENIALDSDIPTLTSELTNDSNFVVDANYVHTDNNFTNALLTKLNGIESGAEVNDIETISKNGTALTITNKNVDIDVPVSTSELTNDSGFITNTVNDLTNYTDTTSMNTLLDNKVSKTGDTMSGMLNINQASGDTGITTKRTDTNVSAFFGVGAGGSAHGVYSNTLAKWLVDANSSGNIYLNGIDFTTANTGANALLSSLTYGSDTGLKDTTYVVTAGTSTGYTETFYRRPLSNIWNYILSKLTLSSGTVTKNDTNFTNSTFTVFKSGKVCELFMTGTISVSAGGWITLGTLPTGYRPKSQQVYGAITRSTSNDYEAKSLLDGLLETNGQIRVYAFAGNNGQQIRQTLTFICA